MESGSKFVEYLQNDGKILYKNRYIVQIVGRNIDNTREWCYIYYATSTMGCYIVYGLLIVTRKLLSVGEKQFFFCDIGNCVLFHKNAPLWMHLARGEIVACGNRARRRVCVKSHTFWEVIKRERGSVSAVSWKD